MSSEVMVRVTREDAVRCLEELRGAIGELDGLLAQLQAAVREQPEAAFDVEMPHLLRDAPFPGPFLCGTCDPGVGRPRDTVADRIGGHAMMVVCAAMLARRLGR